MELSQLRYFLAVAREGNFARASRLLALAPSTLYRRVNELEYELDATLFDRVDGEVRLSAAGRLFAPRARRIVDEAARAAEDMGGLAKGRRSVVRIGTNGIAAELPSISAALIRARAALPDLELSLTALQSQEQIEKVRQGALDLGLVYTRTDADRLGFISVQHQDFVLVLPRDHGLAGRPTLRLADLADEDFIFQIRGARGAIHDRLIAACSRAGLVPRIRHYIVDEDTQLQMVAAGMGISLTLEGAAVRRWRRQLVFRPVLDLGVAVDLDLIWNPALVSGDARRVIEAIRPAGD